MNTKSRRKIYNKAIQPLNFFNGVSKNISMFQSQLQRRIEMCRWDTKSGDIIVIKDNEEDTWNFATEYGCLTTKTLDTDADTWVGLQTKKYQNNHVIVECILASINKTCFYKISNEECKYTRTGV